MSTEAEPTIRTYPDFPRLKVGDVTYSETQQDTFVSAMLGMYFSPSLEKLHGVIQEMATDPKPANMNSQPYLDFVIYNFVITYANILGLAMANPPLVKPEAKIFTRDMFGDAAAQASTWKKTDTPTRHGATIGAYDPTHPFHLINMRLVWPHVTRLMVGVDPNWLLKERKSQPGDERPRFPYLLYRMWQIACLPMVDMVFELPIEPGEKVKEKLPSIWDNLGVTLMSTEPNHEHLAEYQQQMKDQGGAVLTNKKYPWWAKFLQIKSTSNVARLERVYYDKKWGPDKWREIMQKREVQIARRIKNHWGE